MRTLIETNGIIRSVQMSGSGPPLLLLHGFTGTMNTWVPFIEKWSKRYRIISVDIVGHGNTQAPNHPRFFSMEAEAKALIALLDHLKIERTHVLGYSMGARLALYMKVNAPDRVDGLIMESGSPGLEDEQERLTRCARDNELAEKIEKQGIESFVDFLESNPLFVTQKSLNNKQQSQIREERLSQSAEGLANSLRGMGTGRQPSLWQDLSSISGPIHFIAGQWDSKFVDIAKKMAHTAKNAHFHLVTHSGHAIHVEQSEVFDRIVYEGFYQTISEG
jgi:2-succinyl-6-hydroxy-2,4-cyclohexadiene-1-carboxylate synthase